MMTSSTLWYCLLSGFSHTTEESVDLMLSFKYYHFKMIPTSTDLLSLFFNCSSLAQFLVFVLFPVIIYLLINLFIHAVNGSRQLQAIMSSDTRRLSSVQKFANRWSFSKRNLFLKVPPFYDESKYYKYLSCEKRVAWCE